MTNEELETRLVEAIAARGIDAQLYPPAESRDPAAPLVWVKYRGTRYSQRDVSGASIRCDACFEVTATGAPLRGSSGLYHTMQAVRLLLEGYEPGPGAEPLQIDREQCTHLADGTQRVTQIWKIRNTWINEQPDHYADRPPGA